MVMGKRVSSGTIILILVMMLFSISIGCVSETNELEPVEIRQYEGKDLSSINDFRENSIKGPQHIDMEKYKLKITGLVEHVGEFTFEDVVDKHQKYEKVVTLRCVEGWSATILWEGILVRELIEGVGALDEAEVVIFHAYDGYTTSLPIEYILNENIIMAYKMNHVILPPERGAPFQLVAESKWGYKWIKWITEIELSDDIDYLGFWESRGYSNEADEDEPFFDR
jgi:DMSO/TMAO reductase YedYZ molybdopterin-dependent catalytic subunit